MFEKDNTIFKTYGNNKLMAVKLWSMLTDAGERVTKFKFEFREFDKNRQKGDRNTGGVDVYMDTDEFTYFCKILESGRIWGLIANSGNKPAYEHFGGKTESKGLQIGSGDKGLLITGQQGPGRKTQTGAMIPDYKSWNPSNSKKIVLAINDQIAVQLGSAGLRAIQYLDAWTVLETAELNLTRINATKDNSQNNSYQNGYGQWDNRAYDQGYAAQGSQSYGGYDEGYGRRQGYDQGYAVQGSQW